MISKFREVFLVAFFVVLSALQVWSQSGADGLLSALASEDDEEDKLVLLLQLTKRGDTPAEAIKFAKEALDLSRNLNDELSEAESIQQIGRWQIQLGQLDSARYHLSQSLYTFQNFGQLKKMARTYAYFAFLHEKNRSLDSAKWFYQKSIDVAESVQDESSSALYHLYLGQMESVRGNNNDALHYLKIANSYFDVPEKKDSAWISLNGLAIVYDEMGLYPEALEYYLKAFEIIEQLDNQEGLLILANNLGTIHHELGKFEEARDFYSRGLETARMNNLKADEAMLLNNISIVHSEEGDTLQALKLLRRAHRLQNEEGQDCDLAYTCEGLGEVMTWKKDYDSANYYYDQALSWATKCGFQGSITSIYRNKGLLAIQQKQHSKAEKLLLKSLELANKSNYGLEKQEAAKELFKFYRNANDLKKALEYQLMYSSLKDSLFDAGSTERIARLKAEYDFRREIESLEYKKMADEMRLNEELRQKEAYQNSILVVLVLTTLLAATLGRSYYLVQNHNKKLTALNEEKNTLMGVVAHDLRSPLNNIKGLMALVKMENSSLSPEQSHYFHLVDDTMERMRDMIDRVLDVSVVEDMKVNLNLKKVDLGQTMNFVAGNFELLASKKSIELHADLDVKSHFVVADYNYLLQVIENLLSNAIKFSESDKNIYLNIFQEDGSETMIIRDEGPGISEEDQKRLFSKFQKLSAKPTDNEKSTGLGLSIVKKFVDAMDAEISCESELGSGTSFIIKFKTAEEKELV